MVHIEPEVAVLAYELIVVPSEPLFGLLGLGRDGLESVDNRQRAISDRDGTWIPGANGYDAMQPGFKAASFSIPDLLRFIPYLVYWIVGTQGTVDEFPGLVTFANGDWIEERCCGRSGTRSLPDGEVPISDRVDRVTA